MGSSAKTVGYEKKKKIPGRIEFYAVKLFVPFNIKINTTGRGLWCLGESYKKLV